MGFNAETADIEPLDFDFTGFGVKGAGAVGTVPEPSQAAMKTFQQFQLRMNVEFQKMRAVDLATVSEAELKKIQKRGADLEVELDEALAALCSNVPTAEVLAKLDFRPKQAFSKFLLDAMTPKG